MDDDDQCSGTPYAVRNSVDSTGCYNEPTQQVDDSGGNTNSDSSDVDGEDDEVLSAWSSIFFCVIGLAIIIGLVTIINQGGKTKQRVVQHVPVNYSAQQQRVQSAVNQLDQQRQQAQHEASQLRKQLSDSASYTATQMQDMKAEMARLQDTATQAEQEKLEMQGELEKVKSTTVVQNITYNIQDSAIAGDINANPKEKND
jgi:hypothetical protein